MLRVALVGAGVMGANHARIIQADRRSQLTQVVDPVPARAAAVAAPAGAAVARSVGDLTGLVDAAVVAVPTEGHFEVAMALLEAGIPVLLEKPIAATVAEAEALLATATRLAVTLAIGHVERFNPAVLELEKVASAPLHIDLRRISSFNPRGRESVVRDLMIHDIDIACVLAGGEPVTVSAVARRTRGESDDLVVALMTFPTGVTASLTASRIGQQKIREIDVTQAENFVHVDLVRGDITIHRVHHVEFLSEGGPRYSQAGVVEIPYLSNRGEPLALEWSDFVAAVSEGGKPRVGAADGLRALRIAEWVERAARG